MPSAQMTECNLASKRSPNEQSHKSRDRLKAAVELHQAGRLAEAERIYLSILQTDPGHADCLHLLGVIANELGDQEGAIGLIEKAICHYPHSAVYHFNLGLARQARGDVNQALASYRRAVSLNPGHSEAYLNIGQLLQNSGWLGEAIESYENAIRANPVSAEAYNSLGNALQDCDEFSKAVACYEKALSLKPTYLEACNNLGNLLRALRRPLEAVIWFERALDLNSHCAEVHSNYANLLQDQGSFREAVRHYRIALSLKPELGTAASNLASAHLAGGEVSEAHTRCLEALKLNPRMKEAHYNLGTIFERKGEVEKAIGSYRAALHVDPSFHQAYCHLFHQLQHACCWEETADMLPEIDGMNRRRIEEGKLPFETPFMTLTRPSDPDLKLAVAKAWSREAKNVLGVCDETRFPSKERYSEDQTLTVGYLSTDFRNHPVAHQAFSLFEFHDKSRFKIVCYSYGSDDCSFYRERIQKDVERFVDISEMTVGEAAESIREDGVDILVDLTGHTEGGRMGICAHRPAPIQVSYLGFLGTSGADFMDYVITDSIVTPEANESFYTEKFVYMPHCYQVNSCRQLISQKRFSREDWKLPREGIVFCSFNQPYKIESHLFRVWMEILKEVPGSTLWLARTNGLAEKNLRQAAAKHGVSPARLVFSPAIPLRDHLKRLELADIMLDTVCYNGGATVSNALWAGVPAIVKTGNHFVSRMSASALKAAGIPELITESLEEYRALAVRLAHQSERLRGIHRRLIENRYTATLFDTERFVRDLERAYKMMWEDAAASKSPRHIYVEHGNRDRDSEVSGGDRGAC